MSRFPLTELQQRQQAMMQQLSKFSTIARPIDPSYPTNLAIVGLSAAVFVGGMVWQLLSEATLIPSAIGGISMGLMIFLTWALAREVDPDYDLSAFVGAGLALVALLLLSPPPLMATFWLLVLLRILNRTVGLAAKILDSLLVLGLAASLTWQGHWGYGLLTSLVFWLDSRLSPPHKVHQLFAGISLLLTALLFWFSHPISDAVQPLPALLIALLAGAGLLFAGITLTSQQVTSVSDLTNKPLQPKRIQAAQLIALLAGVQPILWNDYPMLIASIPLWAAILGVVLYRLFVVRFR